MCMSCCYRYLFLLLLYLYMCMCVIVIYHICLLLCLFQECYVAMNPQKEEQGEYEKASMAHQYKLRLRLK